MDIVAPAHDGGRGVLLAHPWWGLNKTIRDYGTALAEEGFTVGLVDLFDEHITDEIEDAEKLIRKFWYDAEKLLTAAMTELAERTGSPIGAVGFSFGGYHLLESLSKPDLPLDRLVTYYATHPLPERHVPVLAHFAADDDYESQADMEAMTVALAADPANIVHVYPGTKHWFAEADRPEFDAAAAQLAFERTVAFLRG